MESVMPKARTRPSMRISSRPTRSLTSERSAAVEFICRFSLRLGYLLYETLDPIQDLPRGRARRSTVQRHANPAHIMSAIASDRKQQRSELIFRFDHEFL